MRQKSSDPWKDERGFTLPEVLTVIVILGILIAIVVIILLGILERRRVDAAANQLAADLRLAHTNATNQLTDWRVTYERDSPDYQLLKLSQPCDAGCTAPTVAETVLRSLPEGTKLSSASNIVPGSSAGTIEFNSDGSGRAFYGVSTTVTVSSSDGDPQRSMTFAAATSRIKIEP